MTFYTIIFLTTLYLKDIGNTITTSTYNSREYATLDACISLAKEIQKTVPENVTVVCAKVKQD